MSIPEDTQTKNSSDLWAGIVVGKYKINDAPPTVKKPMPAPQVIQPKTETKPNNGFKRPPEIRLTRSSESDKHNGTNRKNHSNRNGQRNGTNGKPPLNVDNWPVQNGNSNSNPNSRRSSNCSDVGYSNSRRRNSMRPTLS